MQTIQRSEDIGELAAALAAAQGVIEGAVKDSANPFFKSKYADLASVWDAVRHPLSANGLAVMQLPSAEGPRVTITTLLTHKSGQWISSDLTVTAKEDSPQAVGSAITYARRYALQSVTGVAPEDDDGEQAQGRPAARQQARPQAVPATHADSKPWHEQFRGMAGQIGQAAYFRILGGHGYSNAREVPDQLTAQKILAEMAKEPVATSA